MRRAASVLLICWASACLVRRSAPDAAPAVPVREVRRSFHAGNEALRRETRVLVGSDGRVERDGREQEFFPDGALEAERFFEHDRPIGLWRTWFADGRPRSEVVFGDGREAARNRFWHPNGQLAAEGLARDGQREGRWTYLTEEGLLLREGSYQLGLRDGPWTFYEQGAKRAEGCYEAGRRVGDWTLWDEQGRSHLKRAADIELPGVGEKEPLAADQ